MRYWMNQGTTMRFNDIEKDIEYCSKYEFESIELKFNLIRNCDLVWLNCLLQSNNIRVGSIGAIQLPIMQDNEVKLKMEEKLKVICNFANVLQAEYIVVIPPRGMKDIAWQMIEKDALIILKNFADIADSFHVKIAMEITGFADSAINTLGKGIKLIHMADKGNLGIIYDFYHVLGMGELDQSIMSESKDIFIVHINDGIKCDIGKYRDDNRLWPGDGDINIRKQIGMLQGIGYSGPFSIEVYQPQIWSFNIEKCYETAKRKMSLIMYKSEVHEIEYKNI